jgi:peptidoglycan/LPS O-acetylase OafA/YrhL
MKPLASTETDGCLSVAPAENAAPQSSVVRLQPLDWLRGLMALAIMLYHFGGQEDSATLLGRLGIYGVSIFFILSGLSMAIAYDNYIRDFRTSTKFFIRRLFRILPLLWIAITLVAIPSLFLNKVTLGLEPYTVTTLFLNTTTLFGFLDPANYINVGAWSIGNEMVYYSLTPMFILIFRKSKFYGNLITICSVIIALYFSFFLLKSNTSLEIQWKSYVNPFNNLFLYCSGLALYYNFGYINIKKEFRSIFLFVIIISFIAYPVSGNQINLVAGINRIVMSAICIALVFLFYRGAITLPKPMAYCLEKLGVATYGVYLLHPIMMDYVKGIAELLRLPASDFHIVIAILLTIALALWTYRYIEEPLTKLGKRLTQSKANNVRRLGLDGTQ